MKDSTGDGSRTASKKKARGVVFIEPERCKGCGFCVAFCPVDVLELSKTFNKKGYHPPRLKDPEGCNGCELCGLFCPDFAIFGMRIKEEKEKGGEE